MSAFQILVLGTRAGRMESTAADPYLSSVQTSQELTGTCLWCSGACWTKHAWVLRIPVGCVAVHLVANMWFPLWLAGLSKHACPPVRNPRTTELWAAGFRPLDKFRIRLEPLARLLIHRVRWRMKRPTHLRRDLWVYMSHT